MQLEQITLNLRHRQGWEALDLGAVMMRAWAASAYRAWFATYWVVGLLLFAGMGPWREFVPLILWWLKPFFDRVLLHTYSRSLFGHATGLLEVWRALPGLLKSPGLWSALTLRRLSFSRSFLLPVWQLELQRGKAARNRFRVLANGTRGYAAWLTFLCINLSTIFFVGLMLLVLILTPGEFKNFDHFVDIWFSGETTSLFILLLTLMLAETVVEPLYVASGFSLYLNRRSHLEGWDIELAFRRMSRQRAEPAPVPRADAKINGVMLALLAGIWAGMLFGADPVHADEARARTEAVSPPRSETGQIIDKILKDPVFGYEKQTLRWQTIPEAVKADNHENDIWLERLLARLAKALVSFAETVAEASPYLLWGLAFLVVSLVLYLLLRYQHIWHSPALKPRKPPPDFLSGMDVRRDSLPADLLKAVRIAAAAGDMVVALSLLYRGVLVLCIHHFQIEFLAGDTEQDCLHRSQPHLDPVMQSQFVTLVELWCTTAYAAHQPTLAQVEALCQAWETHLQVLGDGG